MGRWVSFSFIFLEPNYDNQKKIWALDLLHTIYHLYLETQIFYNRSTDGSMSPKLEIHVILFYFLTTSSGHVKEKSILFGYLRICHKNKLIHICQHGLAWLNFAIRNKILTCLHIFNLWRIFQLCIAIPILMWSHCLVHVVSWRNFHRLTCLSMKSEKLSSWASKLVHVKCFKVQPISIKPHLQSSFYICNRSRMSEIWRDWLLLVSVSISKSHKQTKSPKKEFSIHIIL